VEYLGTGAFLEATAENSESEFLQMDMYVFLMAFLFQKDRRSRKILMEKQRSTPTHKWHVINRVCRSLFSMVALCFSCISTR
jgi:hypothetical protein